MIILHSSDWHIGRTLYGRKRYDEFEAFLSWLVDTIQKKQVNVLLVAGDVFDTTLPSNRAQALYYQFLCQVAASSCRHVVVIAGNHDSPSFLNAPKELLRSLNVHVVGSVSDNIEDEILLLCNEHAIPELIVCATPYLRDRDIRTVEMGESSEDKQLKLLTGIQDHYEKVCALAEEKRKQLNLNIPIIAMGHLFTAGGQTFDGDGVRDLYVGSLAHIQADIFPKCIDYLALGHLHVPQKIKNSETMRYSGSPIPMGFGEANQEKSVCLVEFEGMTARVDLVQVPVFQKLERIRGDWDKINTRLSEMTTTNNKVWLEIIYEGETVMSELGERLEEMVLGTEIKILRVKNHRVIDRILNQIHDDETLDELNVHDVFQRCLNSHNIPEQQHPELLRAYQEVVKSHYEDDILAE